MTFITRCVRFYRLFRISGFFYRLPRSSPPEIHSEMCIANSVIFPFRVIILNSKWFGKMCFPFKRNDVYLLVQMVCYSDQFCSLFFSLFFLSAYNWLRHLQWHSFLKKKTMKVNDENVNLFRLI